MWVAVDVMSGELDLETAIFGCVQAVNEFGIKVILVGDEVAISELLFRFTIDSSKVDIIHADDVIGMYESPAQAVRAKPNASVLVAARLVKEGRAVGFFSPGNTGATMTATLLEQGRIQGVKRPTIASPIPREDRGTTILADSGANVDCRPRWLLQFAIMAATYAEEILGIKRPRIGLLANGEEPKKGNYLTQQTYKDLAKLPWDFIGNVEGRDIYGGTDRSADVIVCDGFLGNIVLKATEGLARSIFNLMRQEIQQSALGRTGGLMLRPTLKMIRDRMDASEYGGAPLLGINGNCVIGHGSANSRAFKNAIRMVDLFARRKLHERIALNIENYG
ncbi:MAG: phosphate acyltransferase PlsX [Leptospiraceae bacterium]|nr:phosphate acyltransferase PlsX [Leptospiraceae bacterium]